MIGSTTKVAVTAAEVWVPNTSLLASVTITSIPRVREPPELVGFVLVFSNATARKACWYSATVARPERLKVPVLLVYVAVIPMLLLILAGKARTSLASNDELILTLALINSLSSASLRLRLGRIATGP